MTTRSRAGAMLWEIWRVTRAEAAWKLAIGIVGGFAVLALSAAVAPADDPKRYEDVMDNGAAAAMILLALPHVAGWLSLGRLNGGRPGFPLSLQYTRPVRTAVIVGLPMVFLTALSWAVYLVSALLLRATSGYAFPLLPVAVWMVALTLCWVAASWSTRNLLIQVLVYMVAFMKAFGVAIDRLTAVEIPGGYDWPPRLWPTLFDWPRTDYAWVALIGLVSFAVTLAGVARQRRGDGWLEVPTGQRNGLWDRLITLFRLRCPSSSAARAQLWLDLTSNGLPVLTVGVTLAIVIVLVSAVSGPIDAAINANPDVSCPIAECFYVRAFPPLFAPLALVTVLLLGGNAFGIRRKQGRTSMSAFELTQPHDAAQLATLKLLARSVCVLAAVIALGLSFWISLPLLGDAVFIQMWEVPLSSRLLGVAATLAALAWYEQLALVVLGAVGVVTWVAAFAVLGALWTRYSRRATIAAASLLLAGLALGLLALGARHGMVAPFLVDAVFATARWIIPGALVFTTVYVFWRGVAERVLTMRYAGGALAISVAFGAAWLTVLHTAGVQLAGLSATNAISAVSPVLLPLTAGVLAPWSLSRIRAT